MAIPKILSVFVNLYLYRKPKKDEFDEHMCHYIYNTCIYKLKYSVAKRRNVVLFFLLIYVDPEKGGLVN